MLRHNQQYGVHMILSRYSYLFKTSKVVCLAYSSKANSFLELSDDLFDVLQRHRVGMSSLSEADIPEEIMQTLRDEGIVCEKYDDDDFVLRSEFFTQAVQHDKTQLDLVLVPTLDCNFNCPYCFESDKRSGVMSDDVIAKLINFIKGFDGLKGITITWYGGEPLLGVKAIEKTLDRISKKVQVPLRNHSIVTNGYLFDERAFRVFRKHPLDAIQITLDGSKERHNTLRALKTNGAPTYDVILNNVGKILDEFPETLLSVRVNIDKTNAEDYAAISRALTGKFPNKRLAVYPGIIRLENDEKTNVIEPAFGSWETAELMFSLYQRGMIQGEVFPQINPVKVCCASCSNSYIVGPKREIYKCWNDVGDPLKIVGNIEQAKITNVLYYKYHQGCVWYNDSNCKECFFLPICNGKCAWYSERNLYHGGEFNLCQCIQKAPGLLDKCLEAFYEHINNNAV